MAISVVIATRDRAALAARAVDSVLACDHPRFEVIVVDQSAQEPRPDSRVVQLRCPPGLSRARNLGWRQAANPIVAFTDDDCTVPPSWLADLEAAFAPEPRLGLVFGNVRAESADGLVATCLKQSTQWAKSLWSKHRVEGIANCMAARRHLLVRLNGFDEQLGLGASLRAGEEVDLALRALSAGFWLCHTPGVEVRHHGAVPPHHVPAYVQARLFGVGAAYAKQIKLREWRLVPHLGLLAAQALGGGSSVRFGEGSQRRDRLLGFLRGLRAGLLWPLEGQLFSDIGGSERPGPGDP